MSYIPIFCYLYKGHLGDFNISTVVVQGEASEMMRPSARGFAAAHVGVFRDVHLSSGVKGGISHRLFVCLLSLREAGRKGFLYCNLNFPVGLLW